MLSDRQVTKIDLDNFEKPVLLTSSEGNDKQQLLVNCQTKTVKEVKEEGVKNSSASSSSDSASSPLNLSADYVTREVDFANLIEFTDSSSAKDPVTVDCQTKKIVAKAENEVKDSSPSQVSKTEVEVKTDKDNSEVSSSSSSTPSLASSNEAKVIVEGTHLKATIQTLDTSTLILFVDTEDSKRWIAINPITTEVTSGTHTAEVNTYTLKLSFNTVQTVLLISDEDSTALLFHLSLKSAARQTYTKKQCDLAWGDGRSHAPQTVKPVSAIRSTVETVTNFAYGAAQATQHVAQISNKLLPPQVIEAMHTTLNFFPLAALGFGALNTVGAVEGMADRIIRKGIVFDGRNVDDLLTSVTSGSLFYTACQNHAQLMNFGSAAVELLTDSFAMLAFSNFLITAGRYYKAQDLLSKAINDVNNDAVDEDGLDPDNNGHHEYVIMQRNKARADFILATVNFLGWSLLAAGHHLPALAASSPAIAAAAPWLLAIGGTLLAAGAVCALGYTAYKCYEAGGVLKFFDQQRALAGWNEGVLDDQNKIKLKI